AGGSAASPGAAQEHAMTSALADARARERIQTDLGATLVVEAAAGTGKTTELVARIVALVRTGRTTLDRILSVTFTDLAAGEMKLRLRSELEEARAAATVEERDRLTAALERLEAAPIGTIHSFCADLLREGPGEARADPGSEGPPGEGQVGPSDRPFDGGFQRVMACPLQACGGLLRERSAAGASGTGAAAENGSPGIWKRRRCSRSATRSRPSCRHFSTAPIPTSPPACERSFARCPTRTRS